MIRVQVQQQPFDCGAELNQLIAQCDGKIGAIASFLGQVRDLGESSTGLPLKSLVLEHYPGMTEQSLQELAQTAQKRFSLEHILLIHRYGELQACAPIVFVVATSPHRTASLEGVQFMMDRLKTDAPFWKCEIDIENNRHWVAAKQQDKQKADSW